MNATVDYRFKFVISGLIAILQLVTVCDNCVIFFIRVCATVGCLSYSITSAVVEGLGSAQISSKPSDHSSIYTRDRQLPPASAVVIRQR